MNKLKTLKYYKSSNLYMQDLFMYPSVKTRI